MHKPAGLTITAERPQNDSFFCNMYSWFWSRLQVTR